jgi:hypothetical protein
MLFLKTESLLLYSGKIYEETFKLKMSLHIG